MAVRKEACIKTAGWGVDICIRDDCCVSTLYSKDRERGDLGRGEANKRLPSHMSIIKDDNALHHETLRHHASGFMKRLMKFRMNMAF